MVEELQSTYPLDEPRIEGEDNIKGYIQLFGSILRMRNLLLSFDEFKGKEILEPRELQDYMGRYLDLKDSLIGDGEGRKADIIDDVVFEIELIQQIDVNIDYILMLVQKYHDSNCTDKDVYVTIEKAIQSTPELRSKKELIDEFIARMNATGDVIDTWREYIAQKREEDLQKITDDLRLKPEETRRFLVNAFRNGEIKTIGTDLDKLLPPVSLFGGKRAKVKHETVERFKEFFEKYYGLGNFYGLYQQR